MSSLPSPRTPEEARESNRQWLRSVRDVVFDGSTDGMADALGLGDDDRIVLRRILSGATQLVPGDILQKARTYVTEEADRPLDLSPPPSPGDR